MYFVNWQREVSIREVDGRKVVVKQNKRTKTAHEFLLAATYTMISILVAHPSAPPAVGGLIHRNEGFAMRRALEEIGISTPKLLTISDTSIVEELVPNGDLYRALSSGKDPALAFQAGYITAKLHMAGYAFIDNKAQNYLVGNNNSVVRTDLGFIQRTRSVFPRSMDVGSFLASAIDLQQYAKIERAFFDGYRETTQEDFPYLSIILRNILAIGFSSDHAQAIRNMALKSAPLSRCSRI
jgi:tRNA A-37 threonylcarbamoyl transferase component Bud32